MQIDSSEFTFKRALAQRKYDTMRTLIKSKKLCGQAIIAYLRSKGHPEVALLFVEDDRERFEVALECGNIEVALAAAQRLGDSDILGRLGTEAFRQVQPRGTSYPARPRATPASAPLCHMTLQHSTAARHSSVATGIFRGRSVHAPQLGRGAAVHARRCA